MARSGKPPAPPRRTAKEVIIDGRRLELSNLGKVLYPESGFTKGDLIDYYTEIAPVLLPHLKGRALTLKRYPEGVNGFFFYEKRCPPHRPDWLHTASVYSHGRGQNIDFCLADNLPSLIWAANLADIELHTSLALAKAQDRPTSMVFDLDPGEGANIVNCAEVALWLHDKLQERKLASFVKTSGSKGLQLYVPLNTSVTFDETKVFAHQLAQEIEIEHPDKVVTKMSKELRRKKVMIDWSQNDEHKTTICVYSLRAKADPSVSMPLHWAEVASLFATKKPERVRFVAEAAVIRTKSEGDLFEPVLKLKQKLPRLEAGAATSRVATSRRGPASQRSEISRTTSRARLSSRKPRKTG
ncbi:MAG TPA: non-homologous end-joining DNA ligase [Opitutaceae bacterium]|nr:non-homologous end-joining DNA ligase [Opitutaceae bacterium]